MDNILVDHMTKVLDQLEAESADPCSNTISDNVEDGPCNIVDGSSVYRNVVNDADNKFNQDIIDCVGGADGTEVGYQDSGIGLSRDDDHRSMLTSATSTSANDSESCGSSDFSGGGVNSSNLLDSTLSPSQPKSFKSSLKNDQVGQFVATSMFNEGSLNVERKGGSLGISQIEKTFQSKTQRELSSVSGALNMYSLGGNENSNPSLASDHEIRSDARTFVQGNATIPGKNTSENQKLDKFAIDCHPDKNQLDLSEPVTSHRDDRISESLNLEADFKNTVNNLTRPQSFVKDINEPSLSVTMGDVDRLKELVASSSTSPEGISQSQQRPMGEEKVPQPIKHSDQMSFLSNPTTSSSTTTISSSVPPEGVKTGENLCDLITQEEENPQISDLHLQSSGPSSQVVPKSNLLTLFNDSTTADTNQEEEIDSSSDEEMTAEEKLILEAELESELKRLNGSKVVSSISSKEREPPTESRSINNIDNPESIKISSILLSSPPPSSTSSSSSPTINTGTSSTSPSSPTPYTKSKEMPSSIVSDNDTFVGHPPNESHHLYHHCKPLSSSSDEPNSFDIQNADGEEVSSATDPHIHKDENPDVDNESIRNAANRPIRPATLPLTHSVQSSQPGQTPMLETSQSQPQQQQPPSPSQSLSTSNNQAESDPVPEAVQSNDHSSIGYFKPFWIPDDDALFCMICYARFTVMKRRHHCRACGKVLCAQCSRGKAPLAYLGYDKARVCDQCLQILTGDANISGQESLADSGSYQVGQHQQPLGAEGFAPPNQLTGAPSTSLVTGATIQSASTIQPVSVLRRTPKLRTGEPKQVIFSDGIRPGNDLKDDQVSSVSHRRLAKKVKSPPIEQSLTSPVFPSTSSKVSLQRVVIRDSNGPLPPILDSPILSSDPSLENLMRLLEREDLPPIKFSLTKNLMALVKLVKLDCCTNEHCWAFTSHNLSSVGQDEIMVVVEKNADENVLPRDVFRLFAYIYDSANEGAPFVELSHILYPDGLFGLKDFPSFLFIKPTFQCLKKLTLPPLPFLIGILIHRFEVPWAKLFPLRLVLRLGYKSQSYPCPIVSYRSRRPCYFEIGHTVMDILADFRNFQYSLPVIEKLTIHTEGKKTIVTFPKWRYDKVMKALGSAECVLSFAGTFSFTADAHLICIQNDDGHYHTETIRSNQMNQAKLEDGESSNDEPKITGASFIVFSGALKSSTGMMAKMSVVEDGLLVQVTPATLDSLKSSLREMNDFTIECGKKDNPNNEESVSLVWSEGYDEIHHGIVSCIDGLSFDGCNAARIFNGPDFEGDKYLIRWVELFFIHIEERPRSSDGYDARRAAGTIARSFCQALVPCLESLVESGLTKIGLRVTLDEDSYKVGYEVGSNRSPLPSAYTDRLDNALIPVIMDDVAQNMEVSLVIELTFYILNK